MCEILPLWEIDTAERVAGFIAQCGHESRNFNVLTENLNYSAKALNTIFPKYFKRAGRDANEYHRQPEKIANVIYANRMDNGDADSGDGWRFRGGGILQLTGRHNYTEFGEDVEMSAEEAVDYVRTKKGALDSACWFWDENNINKHCDNMDIVKMTKRINGGTIGLEDRKKHYVHALDVLGGDYEEPEVEYNQTIRQGSRGPLVAEVQEKLNIEPADGIFGPGTARIVKNWQSSNGLVADGIVGPKTLGKLLG
jgi:putative chitinase